MALAQAQFDALDQSGNILTSVQVEVRLESDNSLPSVYSDRAGASPLGNPFTVADGRVAFYVAGGAYKVTLTAGSYSRVLRYRAVGLAQELDYGATGAAVLQAATAAAAQTAMGISAFAQTLLDDTSASAARTTLGIPSVPREVLTGNRTYYVRTDGSNSNNGLANTSGGAFLTIQKAVDVIATLDLGGFSATVQVAAGTYTGAINLKSLVGGEAIILGDETTPSNVVINPAAGAVVADGIVGIWHVRGVKITTSAGPGHALRSQAGSVLKFQNLDFGALSGVAPFHLYAQGGRIVATGNYRISGAATRHLRAEGGGLIDVGTRTVTISGTIALPFADALIASLIVANGMTFSGTYTVTGARYSAASNSVIHTNGGGASYFPGDVAGATSTGGQYV